jgi:hypothetical protein
MKIEIESPMRALARDNEPDAYQPVFRGLELEVEAQIPEVSLRNLQVLLKAGLRVATMAVVEHGHILVTFEMGETYLATGFAIGVASDLSLAFAKFASEAFPGTQQDWENHLAYMLPAGWRGLIDPKATAFESCLQPRIFAAAESVD